MREELLRHARRAGLVSLLVVAMLAFSVSLSEGDAPVRGGRYAGETSRLQPISFRVTRSGRLIRALEVRVISGCADGETDHSVFGLRPIAIRRTGRFSASQRFTEAGGKAVVRIAGGFRGGGRYAVGRLRTSIRRDADDERERDATTCRSGAIGFAAILERSSRTRVGSLRQLTGSAGCIRRRRVRGCARARGLSEPSSVAVSPDGRNVYVAPDPRGGILVFERKRRTGALRQLRGAGGCIRKGGGIGCTPARALYALKVVVAPGGRHVYAVGGAAVVVMRRSPRTGSLRQLAGTAGCLTGRGDDGCARARGLPRGPQPEALSDIALTPDGRHAYVSAATGAVPPVDRRSDNSIVVFRRDRVTGALSQPAGSSGCLTWLGLDGCKRARRLGDGVSIQPSPDGRHLYVGSQLEEPALQLFTRDRGSGALREIGGRKGCLTAFRVGSCARLRGRGGEAVAVSDDGRHVYVAGGEGDLIAFRRRWTTGALRQLRGSAGCLKNEGGGGCAPARGLDGPADLALSRDGRSVYVAASPSDSVAAFVRERRTGRLLQLKGKSGCLASGDRLDRELAATKTCARVRGLSFPIGIATSPEGRSVYAISFDPAGVTVFKRRRP